MKGSEKANQKSAVLTSSVWLGVELAALVDELRHRLAEHEDRGGRGQQDQHDHPHAVGHRRAQVVELAAGGVAGQGREDDGRDRDREHALGQHVDPEGLVDRRRGEVAERLAFDRALDQGREEAVDREVEVDQPEADRHRQHQDQDPLDQAAAPLEDALQAKGRVAQVVGDQRQLQHGADQDADRVGVDLLALGEGRREADQHGDDRHVPEQRSDREDAEAVVAVEDADDHARDAEQDEDREEQLGEAHGERLLGP